MGPEGYMHAGGWMDAGCWEVGRMIVVVVVVVFGGVEWPVGGRWTLVGGGRSDQ